GCATVTAGGGGAADACCRCSQPASAIARRRSGAMLTTGRTRDVLFRSWGGVVALKENSLIPCRQRKGGGPGSGPCPKIAMCLHKVQERPGPHSSMPALWRKFFCPSPDEGGIVLRTALLPEWAGDAAIELRCDQTTRGRPWTTQFPHAQPS